MIQLLRLGDASWFDILPYTECARIWSGSLSIADFTYIWTAEGWLYVAAVIDLFSRRLLAGR